ncbi:sensor histidine kinase [Lonepinella koalarum]|uniref:sensor histidine kinase n=1 Tax=Lonepinella koalarum TaxID=53417 RepID=UPI003F6DB13C
MTTKFHLSELLDLNQLKVIQNMFSKAIGVALVFVDPNGVPVIEPSGFSDFCRICRESPTFANQCFQCDKAGGLAAMRANKPVVYRCNCGFVEFAVPLIVNEEYLGAFISGQIRVEGNREEDIPYIVDHSEEWKNNPNLLKAYYKVNTIPYERFESSAYLLFNITRSLAEKNYLNIMQNTLHSQTLQLETEKRTRAELEKSLSEAEYKALSYQINPHFLFNVLNTIGRLALLENAMETENMVYQFSDMMRYILKKGKNNRITIGTELNLIENYISIQKLRLVDRFDYKIDVDKKYLDIECPFLIWQPIVENFFKYVAELKEKSSFISITAYEEQQDLCIKFADNGDGIPTEVIANIYNNSLTDDDYKVNSVGLKNIHHRLKLSFGSDYGLIIQSKQEPNMGTTIILKIPMAVNEASYV